MGIKEESLRKALEVAACRTLPKVFVENDIGFWLKAIALVKKNDMTQSYCLVERRYDGLVTYTADFGSAAAISGLLAVYPYVMLDRAKYDFKGSDEDFKRTLTKGYGMTKEELESISPEHLKELRVKYAIMRQEEAVERYAENGIMEFEPEKDENGFVNIGGASEYTGKKDTSDKLVDGYGNVEIFKETSSASAVRRGRKPKK